MAVGVDQHLLQSRADGDIFEEARPAPASRLPAMPPRSCLAIPGPSALRGARFATITTLRPIRASGLYASAMPATMLRGCASPISTSGAAACPRPSPARLTSPRRRADPLSAKSSMVICAVSAAADGHRSCPASACCRAYSSVSSSFIFSMDGFRVGPRKHAAHRAQLLPGCKCPQCRSRCALCHGAS